MIREGFVATERALLRSEHFKPDDFDRPGQIGRLRHGVNHLSLTSHLIYKRYVCHLAKEFIKDRVKSK